MLLLLEGMRAVPKAERHRLREFSTEEAYADWKLRLVYEKLEPEELEYGRLEAEYQGLWMIEDVGSVLDAGWCGADNCGYRGRCGACGNAGRGGSRNDGGHDTGTARECGSRKGHNGMRPGNGGMSSVWHGLRYMKKYTENLCRMHKRIAER